MKDNLKIGIIVADYDEYKPLSDRIEKGSFENYNFLNHTGHCFDIKSENRTASVISVLCGIGKVNAAAAAMKLCDEGCDIILNYGLSGGISGVKRGDLCVPDRYLEHDFDLTGIGYKPCEKPSQKYVYEADSKLISILKQLYCNIKSGTAVSGDCFVCDNDKRIFLRDTFNAASCDMETAAIAYVCDASGIPFAALRRISDNAGEDAYDSYREMNTSCETLLSDAAFDVVKAVLDSKIF